MSDRRIIAGIVEKTVEEYPDYVAVRWIERNRFSGKHTVN